MQAAVDARIQEENSAVKEIGITGIVLLLNVGFIFLKRG